LRQGLGPARIFTKEPTLLVDYTVSNVRGVLAVTTNIEGLGGTEAILQDFVPALFERARAIRLPELVGERPAKALYYLPDRGGVCVVALYTRDLTEQQLLKILTYRLAQYVAVDFIDVDKAAESRMEHEPFSNTAPDEVHVIACATDTGEILCYIALKGAIHGQESMTLRTRTRPVLPVENLFGWGIFNRLSRLPDVPLARIRELGRFMKNHQRPKCDEWVTRAIAEVGAAVFNMLVGVLRSEIDACVGDFEEAIGKKHLDFFHVPLVTLHGVVPFAEDDAYLRPHVQTSAVLPFAFLVADLPFAISRLEAVEQALNRPAREGLAALRALKEVPSAVQESTLVPPTGLPELSKFPMPQEPGDMARRRKWLNEGEALRQHNVFSTLSIAEAAVLSTLCECVSVEPNALIVGQGDPGDALYLVEAGNAEIRDGGDDGTRGRKAVIEQGCVIGLTGLVGRSIRKRDIVARTPVRLLKLSKQTYDTYLRPLVDVHGKCAQMAL
jgi:Cyclic nucleotide-binding domain